MGQTSPPSKSNVPFSGHLQTLLEFPALSEGADTPAEMGGRGDTPFLKRAGQSVSLISPSSPSNPGKRLRVGRFRWKQMRLGNGVLGRGGGCREKAGKRASQEGEEALKANPLPGEGPSLTPIRHMAAGRLCSRHRARRGGAWPAETGMVSALVAFGPWSESNGSQ